MKVKSKYAMTAYTSFVTAPGEVLDQEDFVGRLVKLGMDREAAEQSLKNAVDRGDLILVEDDGETPVTDPVAEGKPEEPAAEEPAAEEPVAEEPATEAAPAPEAVAEEKPAPKKRGRPKKSE